MGHREQLMTAAKRCLEERGYARTTSRDIAAAAGAPLGTINYHYGSKDALLNRALLESLWEWGDRAAATSGEDDGTPGERIVAMWARMIDSQLTERALMVASVEAMAQAERSPEIRQQLADALERSRTGLAAQLHGLDGIEPTEETRAVGSVHSALVAGLTQQWLVDPERAPSAREVAIGLRAIARDLEGDA
ncbi:TetR/AcrR family transcriptional regulator [Jiangella sp. DSM 45060]|uniref:TetR/AcrR family transcriptional regulator n=1 Tax=Jiangella sp. DSM 45060 TaxID=1798224 RepID=UPI00087D5301|nr:TetR/AcrR family transcriptional regulator [Jiangella sp. DSM 45060]SDT53290.1 DNA-binding transcriptional regulator, AcrR family [Jiangella sp. DSM 45060]